MVGKVFLLDKSDNGRVGHHWMRGRILNGDVVLCVKHTGDCFCNTTYTQLFPDKCLIKYPYP